MSCRRGRVVYDRDTLRDYTTSARSLILLLRDLEIDEKMRIGLNFCTRLFRTGYGLLIYLLQSKSYQLILIFPTSDAQCLLVQSQTKQNLYNGYKFCLSSATNINTYIEYTQTSKQMFAELENALCSLALPLRLLLGSQI